MDETILQKVANATNIQEGKEGVRIILLTIFREGRISTKNLSQKTNLPIPVIAAVRKELEKEQLLNRKGGAILTDKGLKFLRESLNIQNSRPSPHCAMCERTGIEISPKYQLLLKKIRNLEEREPSLKPELDQSRCTTITKLRRALLLDAYNDIEGRNLVLLGDGDLISITVALIGHPRQLVVFDIDDEILAFIDAISKEESLKISTIHHDLRQPIAPEFCGQFDVFITDPPYTRNGFELFISRGIDLLRQESGKHGYISFSHKPPNEMLVCQRILGEMNLFLKEIILNFNHYRGAEIIGQVGQMIVIETTTNSQSTIPDEFTNSIYSGEERITKRLYRCLGCNTEYLVGQGEEYSIIEELKTKGCPKCQKNSFQRIKRVTY
ncbi:MAG: bis-aminopropyl spermidine synthase family protein [Promethearchaeota archaeon]